MLGKRRPTNEPRRGTLRPLAVPLGVGVVASLLFVILLVQVLTMGPVLWVDHALQTTVTAHRDRLGVQLAGAVSRATAFPSEVITGLLLALLVTMRARSSTPLILGVAGMLALLAVPATKALVDRTRPPFDVDVAVAAELGRDTAFPSGHAASSALFAGLGYLLIAPYLAVLGRRLLGAVVIGYAGCVGAARVYLGVHWLTDVVAGWALGVAIVAGLVVIARKHPTRPTNQQ